MANTTIKITQLPSIGNNLTAGTVLPVVAVNGITPVTDKTTVGNIANFTLTNAGNTLPPALLSIYSQTVTNAAQPNITSVGTLSVNTLKISGGVNGYFLQTDGTGNLAWSDAGGGGGNGIPGGANTQVQFNDAGNFGGNSGFTFNKTTGVLAVPGNVTTTGNIRGGNINTAGVLSVTGNANIGNIGTAGVLTATGNVRGGNINTDGIVSAVGNIISGNVNTGTITLSYGAVLKDTSGEGVAFGQGAGGTPQGTAAVAVGLNAGNYQQGNSAIALGNGAGGFTQGTGAVASGWNAGNYLQGNLAVAVGNNAGYTGQGTSAVAIGANAGVTNQSNNSIIINATGSTLNQTTANTFTVAPIRNDNSNITNALYYNTTTKEVTYGSAGSANTGNVTFNDINIIGTGNLHLQPVPGEGAGSYLDIFLTSGPDIHLVASANANLILGKDNGANVMTSWDGNAYIQAWDGSNASIWTFSQDGSTIFPTLTVQRGDNPSGTITGQTLSFGDPSQEAIISTPDGAAGTEYSQRLVINPGQGYNYGEGGDIYLWAGRGGDGSGSGGDIKIRGGQGGANTTGGNGGDGGYIRIEAGDTATTGGYPGYVTVVGGNSATIGGGYVEILGGHGATVGGDANLKGGYGTATGGNVNIWGGASGNGLVNEGHVNIQTGGNTWTFDSLGSLTLPGSIIGSGNLYIAPDSNNTIGRLDIFLTAGPDIHIAGVGENLILGRDDTANVTVGVDGNVYVQAFAGGPSIWNFDNTGNLTLPTGGNLIISGDIVAAVVASPAPTLSGFSSVSAANLSATGNITGGNIITSGSGGDITMSGGNITGAGNILAGNVSTTGNITAANFIGNIFSLAQTILPTIQSIVISNTSSEYETSGGSGYANVLVANVAPVIEYGVIVTAGSTVDKYVAGNLANIPGTEQITISTGTSDQPFTVYAYVTTNAGTYYSGPEVGFSGLCLLKGTMISLADGTYKPIEDINNDDLLLTWDFDLGRYAQARPLWIKRGETGTRYNELTFSDGTILRTFDQHRIFNKQVGAFTYPMSDDTPVGTITVNEHGQEITLVKRELVWNTIEHYNIITNYHINLFADSILTSCRFNNIYPITDMKFVKGVVLSRNLSEFAEIESRFVSGLRLQEQSFELAMIKGYVNRLLATEAMESIGV